MGLSENPASLQPGHHRGHSVAAGRAAKACKWQLVPHVADDTDQTELFLERIFHLHDISTRRAGKASVVRLAPDQFALECDRMCFQAFVLEQMEATPDSFPADTLRKVRLGMIEGKLVCVVGSVLCKFLL